MLTQSNLLLTLEIVRYSLFIFVLLSGTAVWPQEQASEPISLYVETGIHHSARSVAFSPDGRLIAASSLDRTIKIWDVRSSRELMTLRNDRREEMSTFLRFFPSGRFLMSTGENGTVGTWDIETQTLVNSMHCSDLMTGSPIAMGRDLVCADERTDTIHHWDISTFEEKPPVHIDSASRLSLLQFNEDGLVMVGTRENGSGQMFDTTSWQVIGEFKDAEPFSIKAVAFGPICIFQAQETHVLTGYLRNSNGDPVPNASVGIYGLALSKTSEHGEFRIPVPTQMITGFPVTLNVDGWIVTDPSRDGRYGNMVIPPPAKEATEIQVAKKGDKVFLSRPGIRRLLLNTIGECAPSLDDQSSQLKRQHEDTEAKVETFLRGWIEQNASAIGFSGHEVVVAVRSWIDTSASDLDRGLGSIFLGRVSDGIIFLTKATSDKNSEFEAYTSLACLYRLKHEYSQEETVLRTAISIAAELDPDLFNQLAVARLRQHDLRGAEAALRTAIRLIRDNYGEGATVLEATYLSDLSHCNLEDRYTSDALDDALSARSISRKKLQPGDPERTRELVNLVVVHVDLHQSNEAETLVRGEVDDILKSGSGTNARLQELSYFLAKRRLESRQLTEAEQDIRMGDRIGGDGSEMSVALRNNLGANLITSGAVDDAKRVLEETLQNDRAHANGLQDAALFYDVLRNAGEVDYRLGDYKSAEQKFASAASISDTKLRGKGLDSAWRLQGDCLFKLGSIDAAKELYRKAFEKSGINHSKPDGEK